MRRLLVLLAIAMTAVVSRADAAGSHIISVAAVRGDLHVALSEGRSLNGQQLAGATVSIAGIGNLRIASVEIDPMDHHREIRLFAFEKRDPKGDWKPLCKTSHDGRVSALVIGDLQDPTRITITCASGNYGKCARFGYAPWRKAPDGRPMALWHAACLKMLPADYGGDGRPHTVNGMKIDLFDLIGVNAPESADMPFEAGWTPRGAVCVAHTRVPRISTIETLANAYPTLPLGPRACTPELARAAGALIFNRSNDQPD